MVDSVSSAAISTPLSATERLRREFEADAKAKEDRVASEAARSILKNEEVIKAMNGPLSRYIPLTKGNLFSIMWAFFNTEQVDTIKREDVEKGIVAIGGKRTDAEALWAKLNPDNKEKITSPEFVANRFMVAFVADNLSVAQKAVDDRRIQELLAGGSGTTGTLLDYNGAVGGSGTMLDTII